MRTAPASGSSWPLTRSIPFSIGNSRSDERARRAVSSRSRDRSAPTRDIRVRPTATTLRSYPLWAIRVSDANASSRLPGSRAYSTWASWRSAVTALRTVRVPPATAAARTWLAGWVQARASSAVRAASDGSRWKECAISQSAGPDEEDAATTPRDCASATRPTRAQSTCTARASMASAMAAKPSFSVRHNSAGSLASTEVIAARTPAGP